MLPITLPLGADYALDNIIGWSTVNTEYCSRLIHITCNYLSMFLSKQWPHSRTEVCQRKTDYVRVYSFLCEDVVVSMGTQEKWRMCFV